MDGLGGSIYSLTPTNKEETILQHHDSPSKFLQVNQYKKRRGKKATKKIFLLPTHIQYTGKKYE